MKFHAYPKLLLAVGGLTLSALSGSAAFALTGPAQALERTPPATASDEGRTAGPAAQKNLLSIMGIPGTLNRAAVCGDSIPDVGEQCDDGNTISGDGCDATCNVEANADCTLAEAGTNIVVDGSFEANDPAWTITGTVFGPHCTPGTCGPDLAADGLAYLWLGGGIAANSNSGTASQTLVIPADATTMTFQWSIGSVPTCENATDFLEATIDGTQVFRSPDPCSSPGFGAVYTTESIDLVALGVNDGGSHTIAWNASTTETDPAGSTNIWLDDVAISIGSAVPSSCLVAFCGDGILSSSEACDDGNSDNGDGCTSTCSIESVDYVCSDPLYDAFDFLPSGAAPTGDAIIEGSLEDRRGRQTFAWTESREEADDLLPICTEVFCSFLNFNVATDGIFYALFGASADPSDTSISQTAVIPVGATELTFDFQVAAPSTTGPCDSANDFLEVTVDGTQVFLYDCVEDFSGYAPQSADISAFADGLEHEIQFRGVTVSTNLENTNFFVDNISIPTLADGDPLLNASNCFLRDTACDTIETFDDGIPVGWTVINQGLDPADGWGTTGDGTCLAENAAGLLGQTGTENLTTGSDGAACADSDATGQVDADAGGNALEMDTYLCSPALDLSTITGPSYSFNTYYASANNEFNDNGTPDDFADDFDEDLLEVLVGTSAPNALTIGAYTRLGGVNDHEDGNLFLTGAQELSANLEGTELEGQSEGYVCFRYRGTYAWFAQVDNAGLRGEDCDLAPVDTDGDLVFDSTDNCTNVANADQIDTNGDGIGNACDADFNNDCFVNFLDIFLFQSTFNSAPGDANYNENFDLVDTGVSINFFDFFVVTGSFNTPAGPSANECVVGLGT